MIHCLALVMCIITASAAQAEMALTLGEAERVFLENNLELQLKRADLPRHDADALRAGLLPNPSFNYSVESVQNGDRDTEQIYSLSMPIDFLWTGGLKRETLQKKRNARQLSYEQERADALFLLRQTFYRTLLLKAHEGTLHGMIGMFSEIETRARERLKAGDISEIDVLKFSAERGKLLRYLSSVLTEAAAERRKLAYMLNVDARELSCTGALAFNPLLLTREDVLADAVTMRPDVKAAEAAADSSRAGLSLAKREVISPVEIEAGYKTVTGGFKGYTFAFSVPFPLFNRNQGGIASARAELTASALTHEIAKRAALHEASTLFDKVSFLQTRIEELAGNLETLREVTSITRFAYDEGEASPLDLLDAIRSERELVMEYQSILYEHMTAVADLERASGKTLTGRGGAK